MGEQSDIVAPPDWEALQPGRLRGVVLVVGGVDTGKTTLARWLAWRTAEAGQTVGWIDGDVGQSSLGAPGTMGLALVDAQAARYGGAPGLHRSFFVGATTPHRHMLPMLAGLERLRSAAVQAGAGLVVVDTTGLVDRRAGGGAIKEWIMELLRPSAVVAIQRGRELEHLLGALRRERRLALHELAPAGEVRRRGGEERARRRRELLAAAFSGAREVELDTGLEGGLPLYDLDKAEAGALAGLLDAEGFCLGLGCLRRRGASSVTLLTPTPDGDLERAQAVRFGELRLDPETGAELE
jgi:polynucleotide 5'-hydroxyl-kinase GRC3/NOL9